MGKLKRILNFFANFNFRKFPFVPQQDLMDCGPACLAMIAKWFGKEYPLSFLRENCYYSKEGVSLTGLSEAASAIGFYSISVKLSIEKLAEEAPLPCILFWNNSHFVVLHKVTRNIFNKRISFKILDPSSGPLKVNLKEFKRLWLNNNSEKGIVLLLETTEVFFSQTPPPILKAKFSTVLKYVKPLKFEIYRLLFALFAGSLFSLAFPILTQVLVDKGLEKKNLNYISIVLAAQIALFLGSAIIEIVRNWILLYLGARINLAIVSDFFKKIMLLPIRFFETKFIGDFFQRIYDHSRIEEFLTSQSLTTLFSLINFSVSIFVLFYYDYKIIVSYVVLTILSVYWSAFFFKARERLDYFRFKMSSSNHDIINEIIIGMQEIKINSLEKYMRSRWEETQLNLFKVNVDGLKLDQSQLTGFNLLNQFKNILVTFIAAREVVIGNMTLGGMLSVTYIIGQMNGPVNQLIAFFRSLQDARLSMDRLIDIHSQEEEENDSQIKYSSNNSKRTHQAGISIKNLSFRYNEPQNPLVLKDINLFIPEGKITAIVGGSGSGKTTLMKLLLKFYEPDEGQILINDKELSSISPKSWREKCGVVLQDGYIFAETIERNIATNEENVDERKFERAVIISNLREFIEALPQKEKTKVGSSGNGISGGQKQRILIARSVYKEPEFIFFDEATSSLDTENESKIHSNLNDFFSHRTVVIIAHRLSTVKNADQIIVLKDGEIVEKGKHGDLVMNKSYYYNLVKNQLDLET